MTSTRHATDLRYLHPFTGELTIRQELLRNHPLAEILSFRDSTEPFCSTHFRATGNSKIGHRSVQNNGIELNFQARATHSGFFIPSFSKRLRSVLG